MDFFTAVDQRHSYRRAFATTPVPRQDLERIVQAGLQAPAAFNIQTTEFVIVDDQALLSEFVAMMDPEHVHIRTAPALIISLVHDLPNPYGISFAMQNYSVAGENMLLAVTALGYASVWMDDAILDPALGQRVAALLAVPADREVALIMPVGRPLQPIAQAPKPKVPALVHYNGFHAAARE